MAKKLIALKFPKKKTKAINPNMMPEYAKGKKLIFKKSKLYK